MSIDGRCFVCAALHMASANGHVDVVKLLLDAGAVSSGLVPLQYPASDSMNAVICLPHFANSAGSRQHCLLRSATAPTLVAWVMITEVSTIFTTSAHMTRCCCCCCRYCWLLCSSIDAAAAAAAQDS